MNHNLYIRLYYPALQVAGWKVTFSVKGQNRDLYLDGRKKYKVYKKGETKKFKKLHPKDFQIGDYIISSEGKFNYIKEVEPPFCTQKIKLPKAPSRYYFTDNVEEFVQLVKSEKPEDRWSIEKVAKYINEYQIICVKFLYGGLYIENVYGDGIYVSGAQLDGDDIFNAIPHPIIENHPYLEAV